MSRLVEVIVVVRSSPNATLFSGALNYQAVSWMGERLARQNGPPLRPTGGGRDLNVGSS
jgi:hypothetical protein